MAKLITLEMGAPMKFSTEMQAATGAGHIKSFKQILKDFKFEKDLGEEKNNFLLNFDKNIFSNNINNNKVVSKAKEISIEFLENNNSFSLKEWKELYKLSEETFVEETESLKKKGAGAGLTDND